MDKQKTVSIARKVESLAMGFIGVGFFSYGTSYFQEQLVYNVPRILLPVFNIFGNVGLAIGMLILGGGLIFYGFTKWKAAEGKKNLYLIVAAVGLVVGVALANINFSSNKTDDFMERMDKQREEQIDEIMNLKDMTFKNAELNKQVAKFQELYKRFEQSVEQKDADKISACEEDFSIWQTELSDILEKLSIEEMTEYAPYNAKYSIQWHNLRMKYLED